MIPKQRLFVDMLPNLITPWGVARWCEYEIDSWEYEASYKFFGAYLTHAAERQQDQDGKNAIACITESRFTPYSVERVCRISTWPGPQGGVSNFCKAEVRMKDNQSIPLEKILLELSEALTKVNEFSPLERLVFADRMFIPVGATR